MILGILQVHSRWALSPLAGAPLVVRQIERISRAGRIDRLLVAVSDGVEHDPAARTVAREGITVMRHPSGAVETVLRRAMSKQPADHIVHITANAPFIDPAVLDATVALHLTAAADYTSNIGGAAPWPQGLAVEVFNAARLRDPRVVASLPGAPGDGEIRWAVERPDDFAFAAAVYDALYPVKPAFTLDDVRAFLASRPDLATYGGVRRA